MNEALIWVAVVVGAVVLVPVVASMIRDRDFKRQVSGKKPMRSFKGNEVTYSGSQEEFNLEVEEAKNATRMRDVANVMGPK